MNIAGVGESGFGVYGEPWICAYTPHHRLSAEPPSEEALKSIIKTMAEV